MTDSAVADHAASDRPSRRALLGAGVLGAALALTGSRSVAAGTSGLSDEDSSLLGFAISLELAARDLYDVAIAAGADDVVWQVMREQHESYAQRLSGIGGLSADSRDDATFDALSAAFDTADPAAAGYELENVAAATHIDLLGSVVDLEAVGAIASIAAMESRHAAVLAGLSGQGDDFDAVFLNAATPISPEGDS